GGIQGIGGRDPVPPARPAGRARRAALRRERARRARSGRIVPSQLPGPSRMTAMSQRSLVTGISGQDGALLAAQLLAAGVEVVGTHRPGRAIDGWRLEGLGIAAHPRLRLAALDTTDAVACAAMVDDVAPDVVFH